MMRARSQCAVVDILREHLPASIGPVRVEHVGTWSILWGDIGEREDSSQRVAVTAQGDIVGAPRVVLAAERALAVETADGEAVDAARDLLDATARFLASDEYTWSQGGIAPEVGATLRGDRDGFAWEDVPCGLDALAPSALRPDRWMQVQAIHGALSLALYDDRGSDDPYSVVDVPDPGYTRPGSQVRAVRALLCALGVQAPVPPAPSPATPGPSSTRVPTPLVPIPAADPRDPEDPARLSAVASDAVDGFWEIVAQRMPEVRYGDMDPLDVDRFATMARNMVTTWVAGNIVRDETDTSAR